MQPLQVHKWEESVTTRQRSGNFGLAEQRARPAASQWQTRCQAGLQQLERLNQEAWCQIL